MAHKTMIDGTAYEIIGGDVLIAGASYQLVGGRTLIDGTGYDINFTNPVYSITVRNGSSANYVQYKGEKYTAETFEARQGGTIVVVIAQETATCNIYLDGNLVSTGEGAQYQLSVEHGYSIAFNLGTSSGKLVQRAYIQTNN